MITKRHVARVNGTAAVWLAGLALVSLVAGAPALARPVVIRGVRPLLGMPQVALTTKGVRPLPSPPMQVLPDGTRIAAGGPLAVLRTRDLTGPSYLWQHGCGPTAAGMVIGYWDGNGYGDLVPGDAGSQTTATNDMIANAQHYSDYSVPIDDGGTGLLLDKSSLGGAHLSNCLGDFMHTSWSSDNNRYGWTYATTNPASQYGVSYGMGAYTQYINASYSATVATEYWAGDINTAWTHLKAEIDGGYPMVLLVDSNGDGYTDHFITAIGYDAATTPKHYVCYNTWDNSTHAYDFQAMASGRAWGVAFGLTYHLPPAVVTAPTVTLAISNGAATTYSSSVTLDLGLASGSAPTEVCFSDAGASGPWSAWEAWSTSKAWVLPGAYGTKTVWAKARNSAGEGAPASDSISYEAPPDATILLVDDDLGDPYQAYYEAALTAAGRTYTKWTVATDGAVTESVLSAGLGSDRAVIWFTGSDAGSTLTPSEQAALASFLSAGGRLFITGQDIGYDIAYDAGGFYGTYLHASYVNDSTWITTLRGVGGDPIGGNWSGTTLSIGGGDGADNQSYPSEIDPLNGAQACFSYYTGGASATQPRVLAARWVAPVLSLAAKALRLKGPSSRAIVSSGTAGLRVDTGTYKVVYFAFGFEAISNATDRANVMRSVLSWLSPTNSPPPAPASVAIAPAAPTEVSELQATATSGGPDPDGDTVTFKYEWAQVLSGVPARKGQGAAGPGRKGVTWGYASTDGKLTGVTPARRRGLASPCLRY